MISKLKNKFYLPTLFREDNFWLSSLFVIFLEYSLLLISVFLAWNYFGLFFIYFLIYFFKHCETAKKVSFKIFLLNSILILMIWHFGAIFWMTTIDYGFFGIIINIFLYLIPFIFFYLLKNSIKNNLILIIPIWIITEFILDSINFSFPWLLIGNCMSNTIYLIQFYEFTGVIGGSFLMLFLTFFIYKRKYISALFLFVLIAIVIICLNFFNKCNEVENTQPEKYIAFNTEKYHKNEKYINNEELMFYMKEKLKKYRVKTILFPEQTFRGVNYVYFNKTLTSKYINELIINKNVDETYIGITTVLNNKYLTNAMLLIDDKSTLIKVKNKLVPYTEHVPKFMDKYFNKFSFQFFSDDSLSKIKLKTKTLPLICYESVYSSFVAENSKNSNLICLIASEKFLNGSYYGKLQYDNIIALRAIENRLPIIKASSNGNSFFMDSNGNVLESGNKEINVFNVKKVKFNKGTFFSRFTNRYYLIPLLTLFITLIYYKKYEN